MVWGLYDEMYGIRPWKGYQARFVKLYSRYLKTAAGPEVDVEKQIKASPEYRQLDNQMQAAEKAVMPQATVIDKKIIFSSLKLGLPVMFSAIWGLISNYSDKFFLEKDGTARDLSYYYLAFSIANVLYMICLAVQNSWLPTFLREKDLRANVRMTKRMLIRLAAGLAILAVMLMVAFYLALKWKIIAPKYSPALPILPFLLVAQILNGIVLLSSNYMIYFEKTHWSLFIGIATSAIGLAASYYLVPLWGAMGAVTAYLTVQLTYLGLYQWVIRRQLSRCCLRADRILNQALAQPAKPERLDSHGTARFDYLNLQCGRSPIMRGVAAGRSPR